MIKKWLEGIRQFFLTVRWCLSLSWKASRFYTLIRIGSQIITPVFTIVASFLGKHVIDLLAGNEAPSHANDTLFFLLIGLLTIALLRTLVQKMTEYCQSMHEDTINSRISLIMMDRSLSVDLEYYDNAEYQDKIQAANRDTYAIPGILWNALSSVGAGISLVIAFLVLCKVNFLYGDLMLIAAIPSSISAAKYTKVLYALSVEQINAHRQMGYCQSVASDKSYAQDIRLFHAGERLKTRYTRIWKRLFTESKHATRKYAILTGLLEALPEITLALIGIDIAFRALAGNATVGDYSLYTGLAAQLWSSISMFSSSVMRIYDDRLKIENIKTLEKFQNHIADNGKETLTRIDSIEFDHVCFTYPGTNERILDGISFTLRKEEKIALVGMNGSGKSTLIKLMLRMYDPDAGIIKINGRDIREYRLSSLYAGFSVYFQDIHFTGAV